MWGGGAFELVGIKTILVNHHAANVMNVHFILYHHSQHTGCLYPKNQKKEQNHDRHTPDIRF